MGWQESIMRSVVADITPKNKRASAFGVFNAGYGIFWFLGSWALGVLYDLAVKGKGSLLPMVIISVSAQVLAVPLYAYLAQRNIKSKN